MVAFRVVLVVAAFLGPTTSPSDVANEPDRYIPLVAAAPAWWTPEVAAAADAAASHGNLLNPVTGARVNPLAAPLGGVPAGAPDYVFIRPGALFLGGGVLCTYNFVYASSTKIGTAGHCVAGVGQNVYIVAAPTVPLVTRLGTVSSFKDGGIGNDWALITIDPGWALFVDPNMAYVGGPSCSAWNGLGGAGKHVGHGIQTGLVASVPRVSSMGAASGGSFSGLGEVSGGDSGSPVIQVLSGGVACAGGAAAGVVTHCATITGTECLPFFRGTDVRQVPAVVTTGLDPL